MEELGVFKLDGKFKSLDSKCKFVETVVIDYIPNTLNNDLNVFKYFRDQIEESKNEYTNINIFIDLPGIEIEIDQMVTNFNENEYKTYYQEEEQYFYEDDNKTFFYVKLWKYYIDNKNLFPNVTLNFIGIPSPNETRDETYQQLANLFFEKMEDIFRKSKDNTFRFKLYTKMNTEISGNDNFTTKYNIIRETNNRLHIYDRNNMIDIIEKSKDDEFENLASILTPIPVHNEEIEKLEQDIKNFLKTLKFYQGYNEYCYSVHNNTSCLYIQDIFKFLYKEEIKPGYKSKYYSTFQFLPYFSEIEIDRISTEIKKKLKKKDKLLVKFNIHELKSEKRELTLETMKTWGDLAKS